MHPSQNECKTILEIDLASYADVARVLEENLDVHAVRAFEDQIQRFVDRGLSQLNLARSEVVLGSAGDNAILLFHDASQMHRFAASVHGATVEYNGSKTIETAKRWFRMGAATGPVLVLESEHRIVGTTIARAVRLEAAAEKGQLLIDIATFLALPEDLRESYSDEESIHGKRDEVFIARRCAFVSEEIIGALPGSSTPAASRQSSLDNRERRADAFLLGACLVFNINAVTECPRQNAQAQALWKSIDDLSRAIKISAPRIPGRESAISSDRAIMETMELVQDIRRKLSERDSRSGSSFWLGVTSALASQFLQNRNLVAMAAPLVTQFEKCAREVGIPDQILRPFLSVLPSGTPDAVAQEAHKFVKRTAQFLEDELRPT